MTRQLSINPPLVNSSNPWATNLEDLRALYNCPSTGAVTTRTSLLSGFQQNPKAHQYTFFSTSTGHATSRIDISGAEGRGEALEGETSSLNNLGYSLILFNEYVEMIVRMSQGGGLNRQPVKPFIISVTGSAAEVAQCHSHLTQVATNPDEVYPLNGKTSSGLRLMMEINLSCPNIPEKTPPAYDGASLTEYITSIAEHSSAKHVLVGIKTPPYTYHSQFQTLLAALETSTSLPGGCPIAFITATNTLGSCFVTNANDEAALGSVSGSGIGGMAGDAIHPLALGNVKTIRGLLDGSEYEAVRKIAIIGVGGVKDGKGFRRMRSVGADVVGVGTAFGREGVGIFEKILKAETSG